MIIGFAGYAKSGKDTAAEALILNKGFVKASFAEILRDCMAALNPYVAFAPYDVGGDGLQTRYVDAVSHFGYDLAKEKYPEVREILQRMGTEMGRNILGEDVWVNAAMSRIQDGTEYVFTDVRFPNEYEAVKRRGGYMVRIERDGYGPVNNHPSETAIDDYSYDLVLANNDSKDDFQKLVLDCIPNSLNGENFFNNFMRTRFLGES